MHRFRAGSAPLLNATAAAVGLLAAGFIAGGVFLPSPAHAQTAATAPTVVPAAAPVAAPVVSPAAPPVAAPAATSAAPAATGTAPATPDAGSASGGLNDLFQNPYSGEENSVANPNRTQDEITSWAQQRATEVLSFTKDNIDTKTAAQQKDFTAQGLVEYRKYLTDSRLFDMVHDQQYAVTTIANGDVLILNSAPIAGTFHWLVELPLMVTFLHTDTATGEQKPVAGGEFKLVIDIGRVPAKQGVDGMQIGSWKMEPKAAAQ